MQIAVILYCLGNNNTIGLYVFSTGAAIVGLATQCARQQQRNSGISFFPYLFDLWLLNLWMWNLTKWIVFVCFLNMLTGFILDRELMNSLHFLPHSFQYFGGKRTS